MVVVHAQQHGVVQLRGLEFGLRGAIDAVHLVGLRPVHAKAGLVAVIFQTGGRIGDIGVAVQWRDVPVVEVGVAGALLEGPDVVELVGHVIADHELLTIVLVQARFTEEQVAADLAVRGVEHRACCRQALGFRGVAVFLVLGEQGDAGAVVGQPGQAGRQHHAVGVGVVDAGVGVAGQTGQAIEKLALVVDGAGEVEGAILAVVATGAQHHFVQRRGGWTLADQVDDTAGLVLAVQHRGRALEHFDAFQGVGVDLQRTTGTAAAIRQVQAVEVHRCRREATGGGLVENPYPVGEAATGHARGVAQGFGDGLRATGFDFIGGDDVDGLRNLVQRCIGLGAGATALGHNPVNRPPCRFLGGGNSGRRQVHGVPAIARAQRHGVALHAVLDAGALQQLGDCGIGVQAALDRRAA
ncbi:hypothetical protein D3C78_833300 [compost metagenome]